MRIVLIIPLPFIPAEFSGLDAQPVTVVLEDASTVQIDLRGMNTESAVKLGKELATQRGWAPAQFECVRDLWMKESNWRWNADNKQSTAYGIPQILGLSKSLTPEQQIIRGYEYIEHRYDTACKAWSFWQKNFYY